MFPQPHAIAVRRNVWRLEEDYVVKGITVPKGFLFDGASLPPIAKLFWNKGGLMEGPATLHDWKYRDPEWPNRKRVDKAFWEDLLEAGIHPWVARLFYLSVRWFAKGSWNRGHDTPIGETK